MGNPTLKIVVTSDTGPAEQELRSFGSKLGGAAGVLGGLAITAAAGRIGKSIADVGRQMFQLASDAGEVSSKVDVVFGQQAAAIKAWAASAVDSMAMTSTAALNSAADFAGMAKGAGLASQDVAQFSVNMTQLAADMASFSNATPEEAMLALGSAFRGETEPIRRFNVQLDAAAVKSEAVKLGLIAQGEELNNTARLLATQSLILKQTTDQQGDFARTSDSAANQQKSLTARLQEAGKQMGTYLIPVGQKLLGVMNALTAKFMGASDGTKRWILIIGAAVAGAAGAITVVAALGTAVAAARAAFGDWTGVALFTGAMVAGGAAAGILAAKVTEGVRSTQQMGQAAEAIQADLQGAKDVTDEYGRATVEAAADQKKHKQEVSEATKALAAFGDTLEKVIADQTFGLDNFVEDLAEDVKKATKAFEDAEDDLVAAQKRLADALTPADALDLRDAQLDVRDAEIALRKAREQLAAATEDREEKSIDAERAEIRLGKAQERLSELTRQGTDLDRDVVDARKAVEQATLDMSTATNDLTLAQQYANNVGDVLVMKLQEQVATAQVWAAGLETASRMGLDEGLVRRLGELGPKGLPLLDAFLQAVSSKGVAAVNATAEAVRGITSNVQSFFGTDAAKAMMEAAQSAGQAAGTAGGTAMASAFQATFSDKLRASNQRTQQFLNDLKNYSTANDGRSAADDWAAFLNSQPRRAGGGDVEAGQAYRVGERGPEVFIPGSSGVIVPSGMRSGGANVTATINISAGGGDPKAIARAVREELLRLGRRNVSTLGVYA